MSALAPTLESFFTQRLMNQRQASGHTISAYRDTFRLLLRYAQQQTGKVPHALDFDDLDAPLIGSFLHHLEHDRGNSARTRNTRLAAIHSLFRYAALAHPEHAALIGRVLAIPSKRRDRTDICFLDRAEIDALLAAPDRHTWIGRRDHALLATALQTGLRASELTGLRCADVHLGRGAHVQCLGKGRKQRSTPLTKHTANVLAVWLRERAGDPDDPLFPSRRRLALSRDAVAWLVTKHTKVAQQTCPSLQHKTITPHVLRHTAAMSLLHAGVDATVIALWLGHESVTTTQIYIHADLTIKEEALARTAKPGTSTGRYKPPDKLLAFLEAL